MCPFVLSQDLWMCPFVLSQYLWMCPFVLIQYLWMCPFVLSQYLWMCPFVFGTNDAVLQVDPGSRSVLFDHQALQTGPKQPFFGQREALQTKNCGLVCTPRQLHCSSSVLLYVHGDHKDYLGREGQDGHRDCHTAPELCELYRVPTSVLGCEQVRLYESETLHLFRS